MRRKQNKTHINSKIISLTFTQKKRIKRQQKEQEKNHAKFLKKIVYADKESKGCFVCGEGFPYALSYHHLNHEEKSFDIGTEVRKGKIGKKILYKEILKCICLCLNCHTKLNHNLIVLDLDKVEKVTIDVAKTIQKTVPGAVKTFEPFIRYHTFGDSNINFSVILRVEKFVDKYLITHEFIKALKARYDKEGIEISWPVRKVYYSNKIPGK